jgi:hypothetical protein
MTLRHQGAMGKRETRTQEALVAALRARPRTPYRADQCVLVAKASFFSSLPGGQGGEHGRIVDRRDGGRGCGRRPTTTREWCPRGDLNPHELFTH